MKNREPFVIQNITDLRNLNKLPHAKLPIGKRRIILNIQNMTQDEQLDWNHRLNKSYLDCGCVYGVLSMIIAIVIYIFLLVFLAGSFRFEWSKIAYGLVVAFLGAGIGKFIGLQRAKYNFTNNVSALIRRVTILHKMVGGYNAGKIR